MSTIDPDHLRLRAARLRLMAQAVESSPVFTLDRWAGEETWTGRRADECRSELAQRQGELARAIEQLRSTAWWLEQRAAALDQLAALTSELTGW